MSISIIIPTYNEADHIAKTLRYLLEHTTPDLKEILVVDGGSQDATIAVITELVHRYCAVNSSACSVQVVSCEKGRSKQMNYGARIARGEILYFLHADSFPPKSYLTDIVQSVDQDNHFGTFRLSFDHSHWFLGICTWVAHHVSALRFGDSSIFITKQLFNELRGFDEGLSLMEDNDLLRRARKKTKKMFTHSSIITTSARKFVSNGIYKLHSVYLLMYILFIINVSQERLLDIYLRLADDNKY